MTEISAGATQTQLQSNNKGMHYLLEEGLGATNMYSASISTYKNAGNS